MASKSLTNQSEGSAGHTNLNIGDPFNPWRKFHGVFIPEPIYKLPRHELSWGAKVVYARLLRYAGRNGHAFPRRETLSQEVGYKSRQLDKYLAELKQKGFIRTERRMHRSNIYTFLLHPSLSADLIERGVESQDSTAEELQSTAPSTLHHRATLSIEESHSKRITLEEYTESKDSDQIGRENSNRKKHDQTLRELVLYYREKINPSVRLDSKAEHTVIARLHEFTSEDLKRSIDNFSKNEWRMKNNSRNGMAWFFKDKEQVAQWLEMEPKHRERVFIIPSDAMSEE